MNKMRPYLMANKPGWIKGRGRVVYDPYRGRMKKNTKWWCVIDVDDEIARYYRWWVDRSLLNLTQVPGYGLHMPSGGAHISVIRGANDVRQVPTDELNALWGKYQDREIEFLYTPNVRQSGDTTKWDRPGHYWFINVDCPFLVQIREEFDLPRDWKFHITIGRTYDSQWRE